MVGLADRGPAQKAGLNTGDVVLAVARRRGERPRHAVPPHLVARHGGRRIPLTIYRDGRSFEQKVVSSERNRFFKVPRMHWRPTSKPTALPTPARRDAGTWLGDTRARLNRGELGRV